MTTQEWPPNAIREQSKCCLDQFAETIGASNSNSTHRNIVHQELVEERDRFKIWAADIGVFAGIQDSLDFRLRETLDVKDLFVEQLETIETRLSQFAHLDSQHEVQDEASELLKAMTPSEKIHDFTKWSIDDLLQSIHKSIDWLHRLSNMVRKATFANANKRAQDFQLRDVDGQKSERMTQDFTKRLTESFRIYIQRCAPGLGNLLATRLVETMIIRHKRILWRRSQRRVWDLREYQYIPSAAPSDIDTPNARALEVSIPPALLDNRLAPSTAVLSKSEQDLVPPRPNIIGDSGKFVCDYCGLLLQEHQMSKKEDWLKHVQKDLDPYICVYDDCNKALHLYSSKKEWLLHMRNQHRMRWHCFATSHPPIHFGTSDNLESHMRSDHSDHLSEEHLAILIRSGAHPIKPTLEHCPFCTEAKEINELEEHVARHLRVFALLSMPWPDNVSSDANDANSGAGTISSPSSLQLAIDVSKILHQITRRLQSYVSWNPFYGRLQIVLDQIIFRLESLQSQDEHEVAGLLRGLEALCQLASISGDSKAQYPALQHVLQENDYAAAAFQDLASQSPHDNQRSKLISEIESFVSPSSEDKIKVMPSYADIQQVNGTLLECGKELLMLHEILSTYCYCPSMKKESSKMIALFRLRNKKPENDVTNVSFGMLFMAHPHQDQIAAGYQTCWQDTHIRIRTAVKFSENQDTDSIEVQSDPNHSFCSYISAQHDWSPSLLHLSIEGKKLYFEQHSDQETHWDIYQPSVSLAQLLERSSYATNAMDAKQKEVLSWLLAKAVWQYYTSPWMVQPWTKQVVHFLGEVRAADSIAKIYVDEPLLSVTIPPTPLNEEQPSLQRRHLLRHKIPKILGLGILLVEIQLGRPIESLHAENKWLKHCPNGKPHLNTNYSICKDLVMGSMDFDDIADPLEDLIRHCIIPQEKFLPPNARNEEEIRQALQGLVAALESYISCIKPDKVKPLISPMLSDSYLPNMPKPYSKERSSSPTLKHRYTPQQSMSKKAKHHSGQIMAQTYHGTKDWFERMESLNRVLEPAANESYAKVRIAVLDTGVKPVNPVADYIAGYKDFIANDDRKRDDSGHGTTSLELVFNMCGPADVFALRVFETDEPTEETRGRAIQAIEWCISNQIDVICMACGFYGFDQALFDAIKEASRKLLVFAAPTNIGNAGELTYPARHDKDVFCMLSTTARISVSRLNPTTPSLSGSFAILGENITTFDGDIKSGTTFSTAIAAGLAGRLLDFVRHSDCRDEIDDLRLRMRLKDGMSKIFEAMSVQDGIFRCLKPWQLLPKAMRDQVLFGNMGLRREDIRSARKEICRDICKYLQQV